VPVFVAADGDFLAADPADFFAGGVGLGAADVCATAFPSSTTPAANMVLTTIKSFLMALLSHCSKNGANRHGQPLCRTRHPLSVRLIRAKMLNVLAVTAAFCLLLLIVAGWILPPRNVLAQSSSPTPTPTVSPTPDFAPSPSPTPTATPKGPTLINPSPTPNPTPTPSATPTPTPLGSPNQKASPTPTPVPGSH
jgi:hypothetical protein